ncbi:hypothetical protein N2152v2_003774 [Parachlorella kessleri]
MTTAPSGFSVVAGGAIPFGGSDDADDFFGVGDADVQALDGWHASTDDTLGQQEAEPAGHLASPERAASAGILAAPAAPVRAAAGTKLGSSITAMPEVQAAPGGGPAPEASLGTGAAQVKLELPRSAGTDAVVPVAPAGATNGKTPAAVGPTGASSKKSTLEAGKRKLEEFKRKKAAAAAKKAAATGRPASASEQPAVSKPVPQLPSSEAAPPSSKSAAQQLAQPPLEQPAQPTQQQQQHQAQPDTLHAAGLGPLPGSMGMDVIDQSTLPATGAALLGEEESGAGEAAAAVVGAEGMAAAEGAEPPGHPAPTQHHDGYLPQEAGPPGGLRAVEGFSNSDQVHTVAAAESQAGWVSGPQAEANATEGQHAPHVNGAAVVAMEAPKAYAWEGGDSQAGPTVWAEGAAAWQHQGPGAYWETAQESHASGDSALQPTAQTWPWDEDIAISTAPYQQEEPQPPGQQGSTSLGWAAGAPAAWEQQVQEDNSSLGEAAGWAAAETAPAWEQPQQQAPEAQGTGVAGWEAEDFAWEQLQAPAGGAAAGWGAAEAAWQQQPDDAQQLVGCGAPLGQGQQEEQQQEFQEQQLGAYSATWDPQQQETQGHVQDQQVHHALQGEQQQHQQYSEFSVGLGQPEQPASDVDFWEQLGQEGSIAAGSTIQGEPLPEAGDDAMAWLAGQTMPAAGGMWEEEAAGPPLGAGAVPSERLAGEAFETPAAAGVKQPSGLKIAAAQPGSQEGAAAVHPAQQLPWGQHSTAGPAEAAEAGGSDSGWEQVGPMLLGDELADAASPVLEEGVPLDGEEQEVMQSKDSGKPDPDQQRPQQRQAQLHGASEPALGPAAQGITAAAAPAAPAAAVAGGEVLGWEEPAAHAALPAQLAALTARLEAQEAAAAKADQLTEELRRENARLSKLVEQVDGDRQQLQREKAAMVGELVMLQAAVANSTAPTADAQEAQQAQQQELQRQLDGERQRAAAAEAQAQALLTRAERDHAAHAQQVQALLARLEAAEAAAAAPQSLGAAQGDTAAAEAQQAMPGPDSVRGLEHELEAVKKECVRLGKVVDKVDADRQQLQREKAAMVGELVMLQAAVAGTEAAGAAGSAAGEATWSAEQAQQGQQRLEEAERQLAEAQAALAEAQAGQQAWVEHSQLWEAAAQQAQQELALAQEQLAQAQQHGWAGDQQAGCTASPAAAAQQLEQLSADLAAWQARCAELEAQLLAMSEQQAAWAARSGQQAQQPHSAQHSTEGEVAVAGGSNASAELEQAHAELAQFGAELAKAHAELAEVKAQQAQQLAETHSAQQALTKAQEDATRHEQALQLERRQAETLRARCAELEGQLHESVVEAQHAQRAAAEAQARSGHQAQQQLAVLEQQHASQVASLQDVLSSAERRAAEAAAAAGALSAEADSLRAQLAAARHAQSAALADLAPLKAHSARLEAELEAMQQLAQATPRQGGSRTDDPGALRQRLEKAEMALEKERRALQAGAVARCRVLAVAYSDERRPCHVTIKAKALERQLVENQRAADEGRSLVQELQEANHRVGDLERQLGAAGSQLQQEQLTAQQLRQALEQATRVQQAATAQQAQREHATEEQLRLAARAAEERAAAAEAVALDLRAQCEAAGATLGKLLDENTELADRLNRQTGELAGLRSAVQQLQEQAALGPQSAAAAGEGGSGEGGLQAEGRGARLLGGGEGDGSGRQVWELPSGEQVSEEELQLLALAEEVERLQQALEAQAGRSAELEAQLLQYQQYYEQYQQQDPYQQYAGPQQEQFHGQEQYSGVGGYAPDEAYWQQQQQQQQEGQQQQVLSIAAAGPAPGDGSGPSIAGDFVQQQQRHEQPEAPGEVTTAQQLTLAPHAPWLPEAGAQDWQQQQQQAAEIMPSEGANGQTYPPQEAWQQQQQQEQQQPKKKGGYSFWQWVTGADIADKNDSEDEVQ